MSKGKRFDSILSPYITGLLNEKRSLGFNYDTEEMTLARFDQYCIQNGLGTIHVTREFLDGWCRKTDTEGLFHQRRRIIVIRQLMLYMISMGISVHLPKADIPRETILPHIFSCEELQAFFHEADSYSPVTNQPAHRRLANEYRVLFRLIYCCGLRNSEACGIAKDQVDLDNGILTILDSKGRKDRLVYMADDVLELCREYYSYLCKVMSGEPRWFFPAKNPEDPLRNTTVDRAFSRLWSKTRYCSSCNNKPTVHDLRFTFVTDRIDLWSAQGLCLDTMMPYLQKYLGHSNLQDSYYYYHSTRQLYNAIRIKDRTSDAVIPEVHDHD